MVDVWSIVLSLLGATTGSQMDENLQRNNTAMSALLNNSVLSPMLNSASTTVNGNFNELTSLMGINPSTLLQAGVPIQALESSGLTISEKTLLALQKEVEEQNGGTGCFSCVVTAMARQRDRQLNQLSWYLTSTDANGKTTPAFFSAEGAKQRQNMVKALSETQTQLQGDVTNNQIPAIDGAATSFGSGEATISQMPGATASGVSAINQAASSAQALPSTQLVLKAMANELAGLGQLQADIAKQEAQATAQTLKAHQQLATAARSQANVDMYSALMLTELVKSQVDGTEEQKLTRKALYQIGASLDDEKTREGYERSMTNQEGIEAFGYLGVAPASPFGP